MTRSTPDPAGALAGVRVIEFAGIGPAPYAAMLLADMGADVIVVDRPGESDPLRAVCGRGKRSIALDLKNPAARDAAARLCRHADVLIEGFRPGVMERLGLGPEILAETNPKLVYGRMTGWGQSGPLAQAAGHDINYVALTGVSSIAARDGAAASLPATIIGDMGGGAMFLAFGIVCALLEARACGRGQVVDAAIVDGVASLSTLVHQLRGIGFWRDDAARNFFLHRSPFYDAFECADGGYITFGAIEPPFYRELLQRLGLHDVDPARQHDAREWPALRERIAAIVKSKTRAQWSAELEGTDVCFAPVLTLAEAPQHPHLAARGSFVQGARGIEPAPAPRLSRSGARALQPAPRVGEHTQEILRELGCSGSEIATIAAAPKS